MSEPSSLYMRVHLSQSALAAFEATAPAPPSQFMDWQPWLATQRMHGKISDPAIQQLKQSEAPTVGETLAKWLTTPYMNLGRTEYDTATETWRYGLLDCSENYQDFILVLALLREIARYKDRPGQDFILIFPYIWGGDPEAYLVIDAGSSHFSAETPAEIVAEASAGLQQIRSNLASLYADDDL